jgi:hypothetical protein
VGPGFWETFYFRPGNLGYPVFNTAAGKIGVYICYDRHFPEGARILGLNGAEIVMNPSATVAGLSEYLWKLEQPAHAVANGYFVGAINRVGVEAPWNIGEFYGQSYFCDPRGQMLAVASRDADELVVADLDFGMIEQLFQTRRTAWNGELRGGVARIGLDDVMAGDDAIAAVAIGRQMRAAHDAAAADNADAVIFTLWRRRKIIVARDVEIRHGLLPMINQEPQRHRGAERILESRWCGIELHCRPFHCQGLLPVTQANL